MTDDERAAWMTPPPDLVRGCDSPEGVRILADWLDDHGGDGAEFREPMRDIGEMPADGHGSGTGIGRGDGSGDGCGYGPGSEFAFGDRDGDGHGCGYDFGLGWGYGYGTPDGDGGPDAPR